MYYTLDSLNCARPEKDQMKWMQWMESHRDDTNVATNLFPFAKLMLTTDFTGHDENDGTPPKKVFRSALVTEKGDIVESRHYELWSEAQQGHDEWVVDLEKIEETLKSVKKKAA